MEGISGAAPAGFSDDSIGYRYGNAFREPGINSASHVNGINIPKHILNYQHVDGGTTWSNFINIDVLFSGPRDPSHNTTRGAVEMYAVYRGD
jgi:hypothetical protein